MSNKKHLYWLYQQLPQLIGEGILSEESAARIQAKYGPAKGNTTNMAQIITSILGAVFVGLGLILIFAVNWDSFSKATRTVLSFLPMLVAQAFYTYAFFKRRNSTAWTESTAAFLMLMLASSLALISQTYHIGGSLEGFIFTWMLLSIPLLYLTNASLPALFYLVGISSWAVMVAIEYKSAQPIMYWGFLLAVLPHFYINFKAKEQTARQTLLGWVGVISISIACCAVLDFDVAEQYFLLAMVGPLFFYTVGKFIFDRESLWGRPFQTAALLVIILSSLVFAYEFHGHNGNFSAIFHPKNLSTGGNSLNLLLLFGALMAGIGLTVFRIMKEMQTNLFVLGFSMLMFLELTLGAALKGGTTVLFNLYLLAFGIFYIQQGLKYTKMSLVNAGMGILSLLIMMRFFDESIPFLVKGVVFVIIGVCFLLANIFLSRRMKKA